MKKSLVILLLLASNVWVLGQELNCKVEVNSSQIQGSDQSIFTAMQKAIFEFVNNRKWTDHIYAVEERIECNMLLNIESVDKNQFTATLQVQATRPVYNTAYNSTLLNHIDKQFTFVFNEFDPLNYSENAYLSNLTSVLSYYVYLILGLDYDSFSPSGGEIYYKKAQAIVNNAQSSGNEGWKAFEDDKNRYWIVQNLLDPRFSSIRKCWYNYHRLGFDILTKEPEKAKRVILDNVKTLEEIQKFQPVSFQLQFFFNAKADELVSLYKTGNPQMKTEAYGFLNRIDPVHANKYQNLLKK